MDIIPQKFDLPVIYIQGNITQLEHVEKILLEYKPDIIFHVAALIETIRTEEKLLYRVNVQGSWSYLFFFCHNLGIGKFFFCGNF